MTALQQVPQLPVSPFNSTHWNSSSISDCVVAFEVEYDAVVGLDYSNPLCQDGRLVIEAGKVIKREFVSVRLNPEPGCSMCLNYESLLHGSMVVLCSTVSAMSPVGNWPTVLPLVDTKLPLPSRCS